MARITFGFCTSHTPQLSTPAEVWPEHGRNDRGNPWLINPRGEHLTYDAALASADPRIAQQELAPEKHQARHALVQGAVERIQSALAAANPDVLVVFGDDQGEIFPRDPRPALMVYTGETVPNMPDLFTRAPYEAGRKAGWAYGPEQATIPIQADLARHLVRSLMRQGFDLTHAASMDEGVGLGHAFGFIFGRILNGRRVPLVPVIINTLYPPNQPTPRRCFELGEAVRAAVQSWDGEARVGVVGSGGLSHFLVDEELDARVIAALRAKNWEALRSLPEERVQSGSGEIRSWIAAAAAAQDLDLVYTEYQACYRSPAGSGMGMGFAIWQEPGADPSRN